MTPLFIGIGGLGTSELILILVIVVVLFGVGKLPQVGRQLGQGIKNFKKEMSAAEEEAEDAAARPAELPAAEQTVTPRDVTEEHREKSGRV